MKKSTLKKFLLSCLITISMSSCNFLAGNYLGFLLPGNGSNATAVGADELNTQEAELFADGPIDIPVSIAKLDSPDPEKISVEATPLASPDVSSDDAQYLAISEPLAAVSSDELSLTITGSSGCVGDITATPYVVAYRMVDYVVDESSEVIIPVDADGSFSLQMDVPSKEQIIYAAMAADQATTSPFTSIIADLDIIEQGNGVFIFVDTNSNKININQPMVADRAGYYYMTLKSDDGQYFMRRNIDGSAVQFLIEANSNPILLIGASNGSRVAVADKGGQISLMLPTTDPNASLALATDPLQTTTASSSTVIETIHNFDPFNGSLFMTDDGKGIVYGQNGDFPTARYMRTSSDFKTDLVPGGYLDDMKIHYSPNQNQLYIFGKTQGTYDLYRIDLNGSVGRAWASHETLIHDLGIDSVVSVDISDIDTMTFEDFGVGVNHISYWEMSGGRFIIFENPPDAAVQIHNPKLTMDGAFLIACETHTDGTGNQLVYTPTSSHSGDFQPLTSDPDFSTCSEKVTSFSIDQNNYIHFYRTNADGTIAQHAMMNIDALY